MHICPECQRELAPHIRFHTRLRLNEIAPGVGLSVFVPLHYSGVRRHVLYRFKDHGDFSVSPFLVTALRAVLDAAATQIGVVPRAVVPIPSRRAAYAKRGFSPTHFLL